MVKLNGFEDELLGGGILNVMYAAEDDKVEVNENTGDLEITAQGEEETQIYSFKQED